ncbi:MAG: hypothetical protein AB7L92_04705 [Alphaproteobacteria bacterium]
MPRCHNIIAYGLFGWLSICCAGYALAQSQSPPPSKSDDLELQSLFYTNSEIGNIRDAVSAYLNRGAGNGGAEDVSAAEYLDKAAEIKKLRTESRYFTYPQYFLESLVFHSDADWTVWISGRKISAENPSIEGELKVLDINKNSVSLEWTPYDMDKVMEVWNKWPNDVVSVDTYNNIVTFTLLPNQTFSSYVMRVLEGKVLPVTIDRKQIEDSLKLPTDVTLPGPDDSHPESGTQPSNNPPLDPPLPPRNMSKEIIGLFGDSE